MVHSPRNRCKICETGQSCLLYEYMVVSKTTEDETSDGLLEADSLPSYDDVRL